MWKNWNELPGFRPGHLHNVQLLSLLRATASSIPPRMPIATRHGGSVPEKHTMPSRQVNIQDDTTFRIMCILLQASRDLSQYKFKCVYGLTPVGMAQMIATTWRFLKRKMEEYENFTGHIC